MDILLLNNADQQSGAAKAAIRLLDGLGVTGVNARMLVQKKLTDRAAVIGPGTAVGKALGVFRPHIEALGLKRYSRRSPYLFSPANLTGNVAKRAASLSADLIHMHWITGGFMRIEDLKYLQKPLVWTMHDSWPFTGGCHLPFECSRYREQCGQCPCLGSQHNQDLSSRVWKRKQTSWESLDLTLISPSRWLADAARSSSLFCDRRVEVIPNGIDCSVYRPVEQKQARQLLNLPIDKTLLLFGAFESTKDQNKGFDLLQAALMQYAAGKDRGEVELLVFGASGAETEQSFGFPVHYMGSLQDDISLCLLYSAADAYLCPSRQENLPNTVVEAMACGTPSIAFDQGGLPDLIDHGQNGYLATAYETADMAHGIEWVLESPDRYRALADNAVRKVIDNCALERIVDRHLELYRELIEQ